MMLTEHAYEQLLRTATFGPVRLGADRDAVRSALGSPEDVGQGMARTTIWAYQSKHLQVTFSADKLVHFGLYFRNSSPIVLPNLTLSAQTTPADFLAWMQAAGIGCTERGAPGGIQVAVGNGLVALFEGGMLESLQVS